jgi:hypothetical protein
MRPAIRPGDLLVTAGRLPEPGEIALVRVDASLVTHRVLAREAEAYVLGGDAPGAGPHRVEHEAVVGTVVEVRRDLRSWLAWLGRRWPRPPARRDY